MADTTFVDNETVITAAWLNDVNNLRYGPSDATRGAYLLDYMPPGTGATTTKVGTYLSALPILVATEFGTSASAVNAALVAANAQNRGMIFEPGQTFSVTNMSLTLTSCPLWVQARGAKFLGTASGNMLLIENVHGLRQGFFWDGGIFDGQSTATTALKVHGLQGCRIANMIAYSCTSVGMRWDGESGYGIYYNSFENLQSGQQGDSNGSTGLRIVATGAAYYIASNVFQNCRAQYNKGYGWNIDYANNTYVGCEAEGNDSYGFTIDNTYDSSFIGGYSEINEQMYATDGVSDGSADESFSLSANSTGVKIYGGRHIGTVSGTTTGQGNWIAPTQKGTTATCDATGRITTAEFKSAGGLGIGNANPSANTINGATGMALAAGGATCAVLDSSLGFQVWDSAWNGRHLRIGSYHFWVDAAGKFRIKSSAPTGDTDGTIIGTQS